MSAVEFYDSHSARETNLDSETSCSIQAKCGEYSNISSNLSRRTEVSSQPLGKIFVEDGRGFRVIDSSESTGRQASSTEALTPSEIASRVDSCFHVFSHFCHGLLAGVALWQCVLVYQLTDSEFELTDFVEHYGSLSQPFHTLLFFLCAVCCVSVFDRLDIASISLSSAKYLFCSAKFILLLLYPLCLLFSISLRNVDDLFSLYKLKAFSQNSTHFQLLTKEFTYWKYMNTARCFFAVLGWLAVVLFSRKAFYCDRFHGFRNGAS